MGISSSGLISGLNTEDIIAQLLSIERKPITLLQQRQANFQTKVAAFLDVNVKISSLQGAASSLNDTQNFNTKSVNVTKNASGVDIVTATASSAAVVGSQTVEVSQLAQAHKLAAQGFVDQNTTAVASGSGTFSFKVGAVGAVTDLTVTSTTTLQGLHDAINSANAGVTASILNDGSPTNPYRLILTSSTSGSNQDIQIVTNDTTLDFANKHIEAAVAATTNSGSYTGTVTSSGTYTGTTNKTFLLEIITAGTVDGTARYKFSTNGGLTFDDNAGAGYTPSATASAIGNNTEGVNIAFSNSGTLSVGDRFTVDLFNPTLQEAQDAIVKVDNLTLVKSSNTVSDAIQGVSLNLVKAEVGTTINVSVSTDTAPATQKIKDFVSAYNNVTTFFDEQQSFDPEINKANPLLGDFTVRSLQRTIQNILTAAVPGITSGKTNLAQIGITSDSTTGEISIDDAKLSTALSADPTGVLKLFVGTGTPTDNAITFVSKTDKTQAETYAINITSAPQRASFTSATALQASGLGAAELLTFTFTSNATSSSPSTSAFSVSLSQNDNINVIVDKLNSAFATKSVGLEASHSNEKLSITSKDYGADIKFTVVSDRAADTTSTGVGQTLQTLTGVDVVGRINNHIATGKGNTLTGITGSEEEGLVISTTATTTGSFGTIAVSMGIADRLARELDAILDPTTGFLKSRQDTLQKSIDDLAAQIESKEAKLVVEEERLRAKFTSLEVLLGQFQSQSEFLANQLSQLPSIRVFGR
jgi:flagellar hook-associated protein 2